MKPIRTILTVDDFAADRQLFRRLLLRDADYEYRFLEAETGARALEICRAVTPDCVLLDDELPDLSGTEILQSLIAERGANRIPVVMLSGSGNIKIAVAALKTGAQDFLVKDRQRESEDLIRAVSNAIEKVALERARLAAEEQLRVSEERLNLAMTGASIGAFDWNIKTGEINWTQEIEAAAAMAASDFDHSFENFINLIHPEDRQLFQQRIAAALKDGDYECEFRMLKGDGSFRWVIGKGRVFYDDEGDPTRMVGVDIDITKRKTAEESLLENQRFTDSIIETAPSILYTFDIKSKANTFLTKQAATALGYSFDEFKPAQSNFLAYYMHPEDVRVAEQHFQKISKSPNGGVYEFEYRMRHKTGEWRWFRSRDKVFKRDADGKPAEILGVAFDITERKLAQDELRESDERMRLATEATEVGVWEWNVITDQIRWDARMFRLYGIEPTENGFVPYAAWRESVLPEDLARQEDLLQKILREGRQGSRQFRIRRNDDGAIRYIEAVETVRLNHEGQVNWILGTNLDVTDRKTAEEELRRSEEFSRTVLESSPDCVKILDEDGRLQYMNVNGICLMEIDDFSQFKDKSWWDLWADEAKPVIKKSLAKALRGETAQFQAFTPTAKGAPKWWDVIVSPIRDADGKTTRVISVSRDITEIKKAESEIKALSNYNRDVLESIADPFFNVDRDWRFTYMSRQGEELVFHQPGELLGKSIWDEFPGLFGSPFEPIYRAAMNDGIAGSITNYFPDHDRWYEVNIYPAPNGITVYFRDLTEPKRREANVAFLAEVGKDFAAAASADEVMRMIGARLTDYLKLTHCLFVEIDEAAETAEVIYDERQPEAINLVGVYRLPEFHTAAERQSMIAGKAVVINSVGDGVRPAAAAANFEKLGIGSLITAPYVGDGRWKFALGSQRSAPSEWRTDEIELLSELAERVYLRLERARAEEKLRESEERFRAVFDSIDEGFCIIEVVFDTENNPVDYRFEQGNPALERLTGLTDVIGKTVLQLIPNHEKFWLEIYGKVALTGEPVRFENYSAPLERWFDVYASRVGDDTSRRVAVVFTNTTERKRAEFEREESLIREQLLRQQAEDANRSKDEFLAMLSHELRSPLNAMYGWTQILEKSDYDRQMTKQAMEIIARNVRLQNALIEDLLDVSRIISGKMRLETEKISLVSIVRESLEAVRPAAEQKFIQIESKLDAAADEMIGDRHRLQQIVGNLLTNAIKFTPENGSIKVRLERAAENRAVLTIEDSGIGIAPELLPEIFDRFRQADASSKRQFGGLGLGLTIVKHLAELHGGTVSAHSDGAGKGATFIVELPLAVPTVSHAAVRSSADSEQQGGSDAKPLAGKRILVVDDDSDALDLMCFVLTKRGAEAVCVASAAQALRELQNNEFDLLISDLGMPGTDGYDLIRRVREGENGIARNFPAIALTGYVSADDRERVLRAGFQTHLSKPVNVETLSETSLRLINQN